MPKTRFVSLLTCVVSGLAVAMAGCTNFALNTGGTPTSLQLTIRSKSTNTSQHLSPLYGSFDVSASCLAGEQMVGGGYHLINNGDRPTMVVIEGSFPSSRDTWAVRWRNPDNHNPYVGDGDVVIMALAYCVTTPNLNLNTEIVKNTVPGRSGSGTPVDIDVRCSETTALALSGGFVTQPPFPQPDPGQPPPPDPFAGVTIWGGLLGTGITASGPRLPDTTHSAMGWHVVRYDPVEHFDVPTIVYVLCARSGLNLQSSRIATATKILKPGRATSTTTPHLEAVCNQGEFTVGGGYDHVPIVAGSSEIDWSSALQSPFNFTGWQISGDSANRPADAVALCVSIPPR